MPDLSGLVITCDNTITGNELPVLLHHCQSYDTGAHDLAHN